MSNCKIGFWDTCFGEAKQQTNYDESQSLNNEIDHHRSTLVN